MVTKVFFCECDKKRIKYVVKKKVWFCSKIPKKNIETNKQKMWKTSDYFFVAFMKNGFATSSWFITGQNAHAVKKKFA